MPHDTDNLERLIDDVAREMTAAPVDDGFARRVAAHLHDADARAPRAWLLLPVAGVVLLAAFVVVDRRDGNVRLKPDATEGTRSTEGTPSTEGRPTAVGKPDATTDSGLRAEGSGLSVVQLRPAAAAGPSADLATIAPIDVDRIDVSPLVTAMPIEIAAISIDRIEIAPMP